MIKTFKIIIGFGIVFIIIVLAFWSFVSFSLKDNSYVGIHHFQYKIEDFDVTEALQGEIYNKISNEKKDSEGIIILPTYVDFSLPVTTQSKIFFLVNNTLGLFILLILLIFLFVFLKDLRSANHFSLRNTKLIFYAGWLIISYPLLLELSYWWMSEWINNHYNFNTLSVYYEVQNFWFMIYSGAVLILISGIFRIGHELQEEQALTI
jgi:hypothetical protein